MAFDSKNLSATEKSEIDQTMTHYQIIKQHEECKAKEQSEKMIAAYLEERQQSKQFINNSMTAFQEEFFRKVKNSETIHNEMCEKTSHFHVEWVQSMNRFMEQLADWQTGFYNCLSQQADNNNCQSTDCLMAFQSSTEHFMEQLTELKKKFYAHLYQWQTSLYVNDCKALAGRFVELYSIINIDELIREEILFCSELRSTESSDTAADLKVSDDKSNITTPDTILNSLERLDRTLNIFLRKFETTLLSFDVYVFYPQPGEYFDENKHILEEETYNGCSGKKILRCIVPGVARKRNDDYGDDILLQAVVQI